jgi:acyl carrier protein/energy-converting hydrogenase Eha subunit C
MAAVKLVLCGRTQLPDRAKWAEYSGAADGEDRVARILAGIQQIEMKGVRVLTGTADVSDLEAMRGVVERARDEFGQINGVIHAAGLPGHNIIASQTKERMLPVLIPKIAGVLAIDELLRSEPLDFIVLFSSLSAITGGVGMVDYVGANAYLDAFAASRNASGDRTRVISINWDIWSEIGMATDLPQGFKGSGRLRLEDGIATNEGIDVLMRVLQSGLSQVIVSKNLSRQLKGNLPQNAPVERADEDDSSGADTEQQAAYGRRPRLDISAPYFEPTTEIEQIIAEFWATALNLDRVGTEDDFFELGGDSLLAMQMIPKLVSRFQIELVPRDLFEAGTVAGIARVIETKLIEEVEELEKA